MTKYYVRPAALNALISALPEGERNTLMGMDIITSPYLFDEEVAAKVWKRRKFSPPSRKGRTQMTVKRVPSKSIWVVKNSPLFMRPAPIRFEQQETDTGWRFIYHVRYG